MRVLKPDEKSEVCGFRLLITNQGLTPVFSSYEQFCESEMVVAAVLRNLEVIGEASACVPEEMQKKYPAVPWRLMKGMRNILIHEYFAVDLEIVWKTIQESLPKLLVAVRKAISEETKSN